jgi:hypothetical protein
MTEKHPLSLESEAHASRVSATLREHLEAVAPGASGVLDRDKLGQSPEEFKATLHLLADLEQAGALRLGEKISDPNDAECLNCIEFERII